MTADEQDRERLRAWDRYKAEQRSFLAHKARVQRLEKPLRDLLSKLRDGLFQVTASDFDGIPSREDFATYIRELSEARARLEQARTDASKWGFPVDPDDLMFSPTT